jgi:hypothetical protein
MREESSKNYISRILIHLTAFIRALLEKGRKKFSMLLHFFLYACLLAMLYVRFFVFYSLKMRETLKVENRCCLWTLILFMCVFSLIFFSYYTFTFSFSCSSMAQQPPTTTIILISFLFTHSMLPAYSAFTLATCLCYLHVVHLSYTLIGLKYVCFLAGLVAGIVLWDTLPFGAFNSRLFSMNLRNWMQERILLTSAFPCLKILEIFHTPKDLFCCFISNVEKRRGKNRECWTAIMERWWRKKLYV